MRHLWVRVALIFDKTVIIQKVGAGSGNRTRIASLEGWSFTTKLYPLGSPTGAMARVVAGACHGRGGFVNHSLVPRRSGFDERVAMAWIAPAASGGAEARKSADSGASAHRLRRPSRLRRILSSGLR